MYRIIDELVPMVVVLCVFGLPIAGWIVIRVLQHQERMEMIRRGVNPGQDPGWARRWSNAAPPPPPGGQPAYPGFGNPPSYAQRQLHRGIMTMAVGFALLIGLSFIGYHRDGSWEPGPWLLGGLIPMAVGFAQFVGAVLSGAEIPGRRQGGPYVGGPTQPPSPAPPPPSGPYTYRPPGNQEELPRTKPPQQT